MYIDNESIKGEQAGMKYWEKTVYKKRRVEPVFHKYYNKILEYVEIDCNESTLKLHETNYYSTEGLVSSVPFFPPYVIRRIPDTLGETIEKYVCSFKPTK